MSKAEKKEAKENRNLHGKEHHAKQNRVLFVGHNYALGRERCIVPANIVDVDTLVDKC